MDDPASTSGHAPVRAPSGLMPRLGLRLAQRYFLVGAAVAFGGVLVMALGLGGLPATPRWVMALAFAMLCAACLWGWWQGDPRRFAVWVAAGAVTVVGLAGLVLGWGLAGPGLAFLGLIVCMIGALCGVRPAAAVAGWAACVLLGLALAQGWGGLPEQPVVSGGQGLLLRALVNLGALAMGLVGGAVIAGLVDRHVRAASDREERFRGLLAIAADGYWEIDAQYRLVALSHKRGPGRSLQSPEPFTCQGLLPWEMPGLSIDDESLDLLIAEMDQRQPFRDLPLAWTDEGGATRHFLVSGEPRMAGGGVFRGYWGVARDVTTQMRATAALEATEQRYQHLFAHIPTPLVLHDASGQVLDANPAAVALFGFGDLQDMVGSELLQAYEEGDSRERERTRLAALWGQGAGQLLPVAEFRLAGRPAQRRPIVVRASAVRVDEGGGSRVLSIYVDDTERKAAEEAVRRSEAMLSHLVATSPEVITLSELDSGRFTMVNATFERLTGLRAADVVGRRSEELGLWPEPQQFADFLARVRAEGRVLEAPVQLRTQAGALLSLRMSGAHFGMQQRDYLVINARDVSHVERERLEREAVLDNASIGIAFTRERRIVLANARIEQMFGHPPRSLTGQPGRVLWGSDDDSLDVGLRIGPALARGESASFEHTVRRPDGSTVLARVVARAIDPSRPVQGGTLWIVDDITETRRVEQALQRARDEAEAASRAKSSFLANTSHELRTPLNALLGLARLASAPNVDATRRTQYLAQIVDSAESLSAIISDILDLSKIEAGKLSLSPGVFLLGELLRGLHRGLAAQAESRGLLWRLELPQQMGPGGEQRDLAVLGDAVRLRQILSNFLGNALKFTSAGEVRLVVRREAGSAWRFEVHDTGPGIEPATQARLFEPFTQADESTTRRYGGTGLGLSICRQLAGLMGGEVGVSSQPGQGSCFWCVLPLPEAAPPAVPQALPDGPSQALAGQRVLVVEDNPVNMLICVALLEQWGAQVTQAQDGSQALPEVERAAVEGRPYSAVLMDVQMPGMGGHEATRQLRQRFSAAQLPIIALTAAALVSEREEALDAGMNDFLTKPIDAQKLHDTLARWLAPGGR